MKNQLKGNELKSHEFDKLEKTILDRKKKDESNGLARYKTSFLQNIIHGVTKGKISNNKSFPKKMLVILFALTLIFSTLPMQYLA